MEAVNTEEIEMRLEDALKAVLKIPCRASRDHKNNRKISIVDII
jgi:hypothetical protein